MSDDEVSRLRRQEACGRALDTAALAKGDAQSMHCATVYSNARVATVRYYERATQPTSALRFTVEVPVGVIEQRNRSKPSCAGVKAQKHPTSKLKIGRLCTNVLCRCVHVSEAAFKRITLEQGSPTSRVV